jgi:hypothetical protein
LSSLATGYLNGVTPYHYADYITNRMLYAGADVGTVAGGTGYSFTRASDGYYTNSDGTLTLFGSGALRRGDRGVLIEGSRTNLLVRSQEFDNASWTKQGGSITADAIAAPDGTITADLFTEDATLTNHRVFQNVTTTATATTASIFVKPVGRTLFLIRMSDSTNTARHAYFNASGAGSIGTLEAGMTATITALANGWYRLSATIGTAFAGSNPVVFAVTTTDNLTSHTGNGAAAAYFWGAQLEQASFQSSYVPTVAAAATRAADVLTYTAGVSYPLSLWAEWEATVSGTQSPAFVVLNLLASAANADNRSMLHAYQLSSAYLQVRSGGVTQMDNGAGGAITAGAVIRQAGRVSTNDGRMARNGTLSSQETSLTLPAVDPTIMRIGSEQGNDAFVFAYIRRAAVFTTALTDAQLQTTTGS